MMLIDASVIIAILNQEPDASLYEALIDERQGTLRVSPLTVYEATLGLARARSGAGRNSTSAGVEFARAAVRAFVEDNNIREVGITPEIGDHAIDAAARYGKAVGHPADLNFGDCFAYACAKALGVPLLYKGDDFSKTDLAR